MNEQEPVLTPRVWATITFRLLMLPPVMALILHWPAGNWAWVDGWLVIAAFTITALVAVIWLAISDPELIIERLKGPTQRTQSTKDTIIVLLLSVIMFAIFPVAAFDYRGNWSQLPLGLKIAGWLMYIISIWMLHRVFAANKFLSKSIVIQENRHQEVVTTGPYALVRHPMYSAIIVLTVGMTLALGSAIALIPAFVSFYFLYLRAVSEEELLVKELEGYDEYKQSVKYRLIPGIV